MPLSTAVQPNVRARPAGRAGVHLADCLASEDSPFVAWTTDVARSRRVDERALRVRTLLHLPRIAGHSGLMPERLVRAELCRVADQLSSDVRRVAGRVPLGSWDLRQLQFAVVPSEVAAPIIEAGHYLRSARPDAQYFALLEPARNLPVSVCSVSPLQWRRVANQIRTQVGVPQERIRDVSRVYSHDSAPPNAISYLLARVRTALRQSDPGVDLLTTAVDRNLGFSGASYRAASWQHWITVQPRPYLYHNRFYASPRQLREQFGTSTIAELRELHPRHSFERSWVRLRESLIFCWRVRGETEFIPEAERPLIHR
jgi:hypothetical protein